MTETDETLKATQIIFNLFTPQMALASQAQAGADPGVPFGLCPGLAPASDSMHQNPVGPPVALWGQGRWPVSPRVTSVSHSTIGAGTLVSSVLPKRTLCPFAAGVLPGQALWLSEV